MPMNPAVLARFEVLPWERNLLENVQRNIGLYLATVPEGGARYEMAITMLETSQDRLAATLRNFPVALLNRERVKRLNLLDLF